MKKTFLVLSFIFIIGASHAQTFDYPRGFHLAAGISVGYPFRDFQTTHNFGLGFEIQPEYRFTKSFSIYSSAGYIHYFNKYPYSADHPDQSFIPILIGPKFFITRNFFLGAKLGICFFSGDDQGEGLNLQPQLGYETKRLIIKLEHNAIDLKFSTLNFGLLFKIK